MRLGWSSRAACGVLALLGALALSGCGPSESEHAKPLRAVVYRGPAACDGCSEAAAKLLTDTGRFAVEFAWPDDRPLDAGILAGASLYVQPGGGDDAGLARRQMEPYAQVITGYVTGGGRYLGICMGGYLAGRADGFGLWPDDVDQYIESTGADVHNTKDAVVSVQWRDKQRHMFFQDGPHFRIPAGAPKSQVLGRYDNGTVAALIARSGSGAIGLSGPHPEAPSSWYRANGLVNPDGVDESLGRDLVDTLMKF